MQNSTALIQGLDGRRAGRQQPSILLRAASFIVVCLSMFAYGDGRRDSVQSVAPDIHVGSIVLGVIRSVSPDGSLVIQRTGNGSGGNCIVSLYGIKTPPKEADRARLVRYLHAHYMRKAVRFSVMKRDKKHFSAYVYLTIEQFDSALNAAIVGHGLADTIFPGEPYFKYALAKAKAARVGIWKKVARS
jgi:hypothetical protein